jgi:hypothetical protein
LHFHGVPALTAEQIEQLLTRLLHRPDVFRAEKAAGDSDRLSAVLTPARETTVQSPRQHRQHHRHARRRQPGIIPVGDGEAPQDVVADFITSKPRYAGDVVTLVVRGLARALDHLDGRMGELTPHRLRSSLPRFQAVRRKIDELIARATSGEASGMDGEEK